MPAGSPRRRVATLRFLAAAFNGEVTARRPGDALTWEDVIAIADELGISTHLWRAIRQRDGVPPYVESALREHHRANTIRNVRLRDQLRSVVTALNDAEIEPLLFKGSLQLVDGTLESIGDRSMEDLDLAVPGHLFPRAETALRSIGYEPHRSKPFWHPHEIPFLRARDAGPVEVHTELGSPPIPSVLPAAEAWAESSTIQVEAAGSARTPSPTHQVLHNVLHSAVQDLNHAIGGLPFRQLLILSSLVRAHGQSIDWERLGRRMEDHGLGRELHEYLWLAQRFAGMPPPAGDLGRPPRLRDARVVASFALGWPAHVQRNLRYAFGRAYLDSLYGHGDRPAQLAVARARHAIRILRRDGRKALERTMVPKA